MTADHDDVPPLTAEESAAGPLPGLESDDPVWRRGRLRERGRQTADGAGRHWDDEARPLVKSSSKALRRMERHRARLDVVCRRRSLIARVLGTAAPGVYEVALEAVPAGVVGNLAGGHGITLLTLDDVGSRVKVACRCPERMHYLDPLKLRANAWEGRPGKPHEVGVSSVLIAGSG